MPPGPASYGTKVSAARSMRDLEAQLTGLSRPASDKAEVRSWDIEKIPAMREAIKNIERMRQDSTPELEQHTRGLIRATRAFESSTSEVEETKRLIGDERMGKWQQTGGTLLKEHLAEVDSAEQELMDAMRDLCKIEPAPVPHNWKPKGVPEAEITALLGDQSAFTPEILFERLRYWRSRFNASKSELDSVKKQIPGLEQQSSNSQHAEELYTDEKRLWEEERKSLDQEIAELKEQIEASGRAVQEQESQLKQQQEDMRRQATFHQNDKENLLQELDEPIRGSDPPSLIAHKVNAMRIQRDQAVEAQAELEQRMTTMETEKEELHERIEQLREEVLAKPDMTAILQSYRFDSVQDLDRQIDDLKERVTIARGEADESAQELASAARAHEEHIENWNALFVKFVNRDVAVRDVTPILDRFGLSGPLELRGTAGNSRSFLADDYFFQVNDDLKGVGLALFPPSSVTGMLATVISRRPVTTDAINDLQQVQLGLQMVEQNIDVEPTRTNQELFIKLVLIWLHNILTTETSGLRLGMAIGLLTGILDIIEPTSTFLQSFPGQLEDQLRTGLLPMAMSLRCMRRIQYTPHTLPFPLDMSKFDFDRSISQITNDLYQNNSEAFTGDFVVLSETFAGNTYTSMTLLYDDPRHQEIVLFEGANHNVTIWTGKWHFTFDSKKTAWEARPDPALAVEVIIEFTSKDPLGRWMADHHLIEVWDAYEAAGGAATAGQV